MCGRFTLTLPTPVLSAAFALADPPADLPPRYNVAPSQPIAAVGLKADGARRGLAFLRWGLVPHWSKNPTAGPRPTNARADALDKPTFRDAFRKTRCLIPADGFYEWRADGKAKHPHRFAMRDGRPFAFAGLWAAWTDGKSNLATCCLITTAANDLVRPVHDRMPVILPPADYTAWLDPRTPADELRGLLRPFPASDMVCVLVGPAVNSARVDGPECLTPAAARPAPAGLFVSGDTPG